MNLIRTCRSVFFTVAVVGTSAAFVGSQSANAGFVAAPLHFSIDVSGGSGFAFSDSYQADTKFELGGGQFAYEILPVDNVTFQFNPTTFTIASGSPSSTLPAGIFTGLAFQNKSSENLQVVITLLLETSFSPSAGVVPWDTNVSIGVSSGTSISTLTGSPFWQAAVDGVPIANLFGDPNTLSGIGGANSADQSGDGLALAPMSTMSIQISFDITPGGQAFFNGNFSMIPAPGALALLGLGGFVAVGRRRRTHAS